jgi:hypothetical protein
MRSGEQGAQLAESTADCAGCSASCTTGCTAGCTAGYGNKGLHTVCTAGCRAARCKAAPYSCRPRPLATAGVPLICCEEKLSITNCGIAARNRFAAPSVQPESAAIQSSRRVLIPNCAQILAHDKKRASSDVLWRVKTKSSHRYTSVRYRKRKEVYRKNLESRYEAGVCKIGYQIVARVPVYVSITNFFQCRIASDKHSLRKKVTARLCII